MELTEQQRAKELASFFGMYEEEALKQLQLGFGHLHGEVAKDFRAANPVGDGALLEWYRKTPAYCWELSAYHAHEGFNYKGMCGGIATRLKNNGVKKAIAVGDGIGDLTLTLLNQGIETAYHDLEGSVTADFAKHRFNTYGVVPEIATTDGWAPELPEGRYEAAIALDFLEHVTEVEEWTMAMIKSLKPGGYLIAQNAFGIGDDEHEGSIPMHLTRNNRFVTDWKPFVLKQGMIEEPGGWFKKPEENNEEA
jgi:hypothetical protein